METENLFEMSQLAEAAYANFANADGGLLSTEQGITQALKDIRFTATQADAFVAEN